MPTRVILDTDIGTDVDDCLALALVLASPELQLEGVTCVYGDVLLRARMVLKLLALRERGDVPVYLGAQQPLLGLRPIHWEGHEGQGLLTPPDDALTPADEGAVDYLVHTILDNPGTIHLIAIGPLTNIALAFLQDTRVAQSLAHLTIMGGVARSYASLHLPYVEHNIRCDPEAAHIVLTSGAPISLVPLDVTTRVRITPGDVARIKAANDPYHAAIADRVERYPRFQQLGYTYLHDPLAAALVVQPDLATWTTAHVDVELSGRLTTGATLLRSPTEAAPANARVALDVAVSAAEAFVSSRIAR